MPTLSLTPFGAAAAETVFREGKGRSATTSAVQGGYKMPYPRIKQVSGRALHTSAANTNITQVCDKSEARTILRMRKLMTKVQTNMTKIQTNTPHIPADTVKFRTEITNICADITKIWTDMAKIRTNTTNIQSDMTKIRTDMIKIQSDMIHIRTGAFKNRTNIGGISFGKL